MNRILLCTHLGFILVFGWNTDVQAQSKDCSLCNSFQHYMKEGKAYLYQGLLDSALTEFQAAQVAARICNCNNTSPEQYIAQTFKGIKRQRDEANEARVRAETARRQAEVARTLAEQKTKEATVNFMYYRANEVLERDGNALRSRSLLHAIWGLWPTHPNLQNSLIATAPVWQVPYKWHSAAVSQLISLPAKKQFVSSSTDGTVKVWSNSGELENQILLQEGYASSIQQAGKDSVLILNNLGRAFLWDLKTSSLQMLNPPPSPSWLSCFPHQKGSVVGVSSLGKLTILKAGEPSLQVVPPYPDMTDFVLVVPSSNGERIALLNNSQQIIVVEWETTTVQTCQIRDNRVVKLQFSPNGHELAIGQDANFSITGKNSLIIWQLAADTVIQCSDFREGISDIAYSKDGEYVLATSKDNTAGIFRHTGEEIQRLEANHTDWVVGGRWLLDDQRVLIWSRDSSASIWEIGKSSPIVKFSCAPPISITISAEQNLFLSGTRGGNIQQWSFLGKDIPFSRGHANAVQDAVFDRQGRLLTCSKDGTLKQWDQLGRVEKTWVAPPDTDLEHVFVTKNNTYVTIDENGQVSWWSKEQSTPLKQIQLDGPILATCQGINSSLLGATEAGQVVEVKKDSVWVLFEEAFKTPIGSMALHPNGSTLFLSAGNKIKLIDLQNNKEVLEFPPFSSKIDALRIVASGDTCWVVEENGNISAFDLVGTQLRSFSVDGSISGAAMGRKYLAISRFDGRMQIYSYNGALLGESDLDLGYINRIVFSSTGGAKFAFMGIGPNIGIWALDPEEIFQGGAQPLFAPLTEGDRITFGLTD